MDFRSRLVPSILAPLPTCLPCLLYTSPGRCDSRLWRPLSLGPAPLVLDPMVDAGAGGCFMPVGGRFALRDGDGEEREDLTPLTALCAEDGGGRFILG